MVLQGAALLDIQGLVTISSLGMSGEGWEARLGYTNPLPIPFYTMPSLYSRKVSYFLQVIK